MLESPDLAPQLNPGKALVAAHPQRKLAISLQ
jgi:hypothetical protein